MRRPASTPGTGPAESRRRRILMVAPCRFPGAQGTPVFIRHLANGLGRAGHRVTLLAYPASEGESQPVSPKQAFTFLPLAGRLAAGLSPRSGPQWRRPLLDLQLVAQASRLIRASPPDVVHVHNIEGAAIGALLRACHGVPVVYQAHNAMAEELPTYFAGRTSRRGAAAVGTALDTLLPRWAHRCIVFDAAHRALLVRLGVQPQCIDVIPPGLDPEDTEDVLLPRTPVGMARPGGSGVSGVSGVSVPGPHDPVFLLYAGNPDGYQNLSLLYRALIALNADGNCRIRLLLASHHPQSAFAAAGGQGWLDARKFIEFLDTAAPEDLRAAYARAHVGISTRVSPTGAPIKVLNYLATGLPVVACAEGVAAIAPLAADAGLNVVVGEGPRAVIDFAAACAAVARQVRAGDFASGRRTVGLPAGLRIPQQMPVYNRCYAATLGLLSSCATSWASRISCPGRRS